MPLWAEEQMKDPILAVGAVTILILLVVFPGRQLLQLVGIE